MKFRITALATALILLFNMGAYASFSDIDSGSDVSNAIIQLSNIGVINGFGDGTFRPDETLTRAQFAKIVVHMLGEEQSAEAHSSNTVFSDVAADNWASGYINYIADREIINGYPDGTFGANDVLNYAQALTILVRLLGYSGEDVAYRWPDGYITKANSLGITKNMSFGAYENVTRANAAYLVYNTLLADKKENSDIKLLSSESAEDVIIYGDWEIDASLSNRNISTTKGVYKLADSTNIESSVYGRIGTLYLDSEGRAVTFVPEKETVREVTLISASLNNDSGKVEISFSENGRTTNENLSVNIPLYCGGKATTLGAGLEELEAGREASMFYTESGIFERIYLKEASLEGPVTIKSSYSQIYSSFDIENTATLTVVRDGRKSTLDTVQMYDVVYYMRGNNTLYAYTDKISGTYEEAYPIKANVKSVVVGGREYTLSTQAAISKMNETDSAFGYGDRVTLLLGRNGDVVDVVDMTQSGLLDLGVLTNSYSEISQDIETEGQRIRYVTLMLSDGSEITYEADRDYQDYIGNVMRVTYSDKVASLSAVKHSSIYGDFDSSIPSLDGHWLTNDCAILELVESTDSSATVKKIDVHDIVTTNLSKAQVIHAQTIGALQDITLLYVKDVTKSNADFGVVTESHGSSRYTVLVGSSERTLTTTAAITRGSAVEVVSTSNGDTVKLLNKIGSGSDIDGYSSGRIRVGGQTYVLSDYVKVYGREGNETYHSMSVDEIVNSDRITGITLYSDKSYANGGIVRVIVVR